MADGHDCCGGGDHEPGCLLDPANDRSTEFSIYTKINWSEFCTLNEAIKQTGCKVFKPWENRLSEEVSRSSFNSRQTSSEKSVDCKAIRRFLCGIVACVTASDAL